MARLVLLLLSLTLALSSAASDPLEAKRASSEQMQAASGKGATTVDAARDSPRIGNQAGVETSSVPLVTTRPVDASANTTTTATQVIQSNVRVNVGR